MWTDERFQPLYQIPVRLQTHEGDCKPMSWLNCRTADAFPTTTGTSDEWNFLRELVAVTVENSQWLRGKDPRKNVHSGLGAYLDSTLTPCVVATVDSMSYA